MVSEWLPFYGRHHGDVGDATRQQLTEISAATIDRILKPVKASGGKGRCGTKSGTPLRNKIPNSAPWKVRKYHISQFVKCDIMVL